MPDLARSAGDMLEEPEGNTSCAKHRQNVALAPVMIRPVLVLVLAPLASARSCSSRPRPPGCMRLPGGG